MLFVCRPKILHKHCLQFLLGVKMAPRETENNAYAKFWGDKQRALWYVMVFSGVVNSTLFEENVAKQVATFGAHKSLKNIKTSLTTGDLSLSLCFLCFERLCLCFEPLCFLCFLCFFFFSPLASFSSDFSGSSPELSCQK